MRLPPALALSGLRVRQNMLGDRGAVFSSCMSYRYLLWSDWDPHLPRITWLMLNPSTADEQKNDPTVERCHRFSRAWGFGGLTVTNLFALRSTDPRGLLEVDDPVGPENDAAIEAETRDRTVLCAWGNHGAERASDVCRILAGVRGATLECLGLNKTGHPVHPLYQPSSAQRVLMDIRPFL